MTIQLIKRLNCPYLFQRTLHLNIIKCLIYKSIDSTSGNQNFPTAFVKNLYDGLLHGQRHALASAITLVESQHPKKREEAQALLAQVLLDAEKRYEKERQNSLSFRIGVTGPPGAGKSTFIEAFGKLLTGKGHKVAVLTVDPSSSTTGGSLLGDKTRMTELSRDALAYIRPSPASGYLGGVTKSTHESILLCESAGYNTVIIETVGVGQSEIDVADMVDMFLLIVPPAGGDELQALKKGIVELVDMVIINKADGDLLPSARRIQAEYLSALKFVKPKTKGFKPQVLRVSSVTKEGIEPMWDEIFKFKSNCLKSGEFELKRKNQYKSWMWKYMQDQLLVTFKNHSTVKSYISETECAVQDRRMTPREASEILIKKFLTCQSCGASI